MERTAVTVEAVREVGRDTVALELKTPEAFDALPGQFVLVRATPDGADEEVARHYTLSSPDVEDTFEITVAVDPDGDLTPWLAARQPGDEIDVEGPFGEITYHRDRDVVAVAGGPGVGPAVGIGEAARDAGYEVAIVYQDDEPAHEDRLEALAADGADLTIVDDGDDEALAAAVGEHVDDGQLYAFGFKDFVFAVRDAIEEAGGDPDEALIENFG
ncbi:FAD-dependent oxidoreductase [Halovivax sp.]|uniref:FAD-dependent oxidoreductase n=1 Tax=Halovivax sp. TaxID=1935978 RepID=UPI0025C35A2E|nr:FAD-dependent oxidoreductase [Halovivax sp.]